MLALSLSVLLTVNERSSSLPGVEPRSRELMSRALHWATVDDPHLLCRYWLLFCLSDTCQFISLAHLGPLVDFGKRSAIELTLAFVEAIVVAAWELTLELATLDLLWP